MQATKGQAYVLSLDLFKQINQVRKIMGVCPQHDVHFEMLTTEEHISLFYDLKGGDSDQETKIR